MSGSLFTLAMARLVLKMLGGELIPYTKFDGLIANRLMDEGIITIVPLRVYKEKGGFCLLILLVYSRLIE